MFWWHSVGATRRIYLPVAEHFSVGLAEDEANAPRDGGYKDVPHRRKGAVFPEPGAVHRGRGFPHRAVGLGGEVTMTHKPL